MRIACDDMSINGSIMYAIFFLQCRCLDGDNVQRAIMIHLFAARCGAADLGCSPLM